MSGSLNDISAARISSDGPFLPVKTLLSNMGLWLGMAALLAWIDLLFCFEGVLRDSVIEAGGLIHDPVFAGSTLVSGLVLIVVAFISGRDGAASGRDGAARICRLICTPRATVVVCILGAVGAASAIVLTNYAPEVPSLVAYCLGGLIGFVIASATLAWSRRLAGADLREVLLAVSCASCAQWLGLVIACFTNFAIHLVLVIVLPCVWGFCLGESHRKTSATRSAVEIAASTRTDSVRRAALGRSGVSKIGDSGEVHTAHDLPRMALTMFVLSAVIQFSWYYFIKMLPGKLDVSYFPLVYVAVIVTCVFIVCLCAFLMNRQRSYRLELYYRATLFFCLCGVGATAVAAGRSSDVSTELFVSYSLVYIGYSLVCPTMWLLSLGYAFMRREHPQRVAAVVFGCQYLGFFVSAQGVALLQTTTTTEFGQEIAPVVTLMLVAFLAFAYVVIFPERNLLSLSPLLFGMSHELLDERCTQIAREHGLTPRETEILIILARGRDVGYVSATLDIARNTVNAHRKNIYTKLNIHSQQELLSLVEGKAQ